MWRTGGLVIGDEHFEPDDLAALRAERPISYERIGGGAILDPSQPATARSRSTTSSGHRSRSASPARWLGAARSWRSPTRRSTATSATSCSSATWS
jgi:hypothetical protein